MTDLISRSEVLNAIDENGYVNCKDQKDFSANCRMDRIRQNVVEMPTAFDLDKIIAELEQAKDDFHGGTLQTVYYWKGIEKAIEFIKKYLSGNAEPPKTD